ncbi:MAG: hypothetical protein ACR2MA_11665 [Egibacteraceae bacterium]
MTGTRTVRLLLLLLSAVALYATRSLVGGDGPPPAPEEAVTARELAAPYAALVADVADWWAGIYPQLSGGEVFAPLEGGFVGYAAQTGPTCGDELVGPERVVYCVGPDYIAWDRAFLGQILTRYGQAAVGAVLAHEYGHAAQQRLFAAGVLPTPDASGLAREEQSADCLAGAWFADYAERRGLRLSHRARVIALFRSGRDSRGEQIVEGSSLDQAEVFDLGHEQGPQRCLTLLRAQD